jgi:3',5'-cyclic AMP phosphodiesterase CpdA
MNAVQRGNSDFGVTVLHVSDTQFGRYHRFSPEDSLAGNLLRDVRELGGIGVPPIDLVIFSGDITERGKSAEFEQAREFLDQVCRALRLAPDRVVVVPGNHDVNWYLSQMEFMQWQDEHDDAEPPPPYPRKWGHYREFVTGLHGPAAFTEEQPYRLHRFDDLRVVVAAMNSTIKESHRAEDHFGWCGHEQLRWFADQLGPAEGVLRIGVLHHNARRKALADNENLADEDDLTHILGGYLDLLLHGHTHEGMEDRLSDGTLVLATGSSAVSADWRPGEVPNQYQVLCIEPGRVTRWARQWDGKRRWIADTRVSRSGNDARVRLSLVTPGWDQRKSTDAAPGWDQRKSPDSPPGTRHGRLSSDGWHQDFPAQVALVTRLDLAEPGRPEIVTVEAKRKDGLDYVLAFRPAAPVRCIGIVDGTADADVIGELEKQVFSPLRSRGAVDLMVVHHGPDDPDLRARAREHGIRVKTWTEYNDLLEAGAYRAWLQAELDTDRLYPQRLYQPQRFRGVDRFGRSGEVRADLLGQVYDQLLEEDAQFVLVLGDAGFGKSFLVRRLAYQLLGNEQASLTPIVVYLRDRDKRQSLDEMVSAALVASRAAFQPDRFQHSLEAGTLALLIDGYDEFAVRVGYANAAAQLRTFTEALRGRAKVLLTTRPSHFRSTDDVTTKLFDGLAAHQGKVYQLEPFDQGQQRAFLTRWFELTGQPGAGGLAGSWMRALASVDNLPELARTPRMLSFIVEDLSLGKIEEAARHGTVTAAELYQTLVSRWLGEETRKIDPAAPGTVSAGQRQELLEELAMRLWQAGERDVTEDALQQTARDVLDLPELELTLDQAAQEVGGRTLLRVDGQRWRFAHQSVYEFLLASRLGKLVRSGNQKEVLGEAQLTGLTIRFLRDLEPEAAVAWAAWVGGQASE